MRCRPRRTLDAVEEHSAETLDGFIEGDGAAAAGVSDFVHSGAGLIGRDEPFALVGLKFLKVSVQGLTFGLRVLCFKGAFFHTDVPEFLF